MLNCNKTLTSLINHLWKVLFMTTTNTMSCCTYDVSYFDYHNNFMDNCRHIWIRNSQTNDERLISFFRWKMHVEKASHYWKKKFHNVRIIDSHRIRRCLMLKIQVHIYNNHTYGIVWAINPIELWVVVVCIYFFLFCIRFTCSRISSDRQRWSGCIQSVFARWLQLFLMPSSNVQNKQSCSIICYDRVSLQVSCN